MFLVKLTSELFPKIIFISLPGWTLTIMGFGMVQGYMFRVLGIILLAVAAVFIGGAVTYSVVKYKKAKREEERIRDLWKNE